MTIAPKRDAMDQSQRDLRVSLPDDVENSPPPSRLAVAAWGALGFVVGAVFWHFIGFWGFVSDVVLRGHPDDTRVIAQTGRDCTELMLDRETGLVKSIACPLHTQVLPEGTRLVRADSEHLRKAQKPEGRRWSILVNQDGRDTADATDH